jgi:DNA modification methylase
MKTRYDEQEVLEKWKVKEKDIYEICGKHILICGDACNPEHVSLLMSGTLASVGFFDPPYGINFQSNMRTKTKKFSKLKNDTFVSRDWIPIAYEYIKDHGAIYVCTHWKVYQEWLSHLSPTFLMKNLIVLRKSGGGTGDLKGDYIPNHEFLMFMTKGRHILNGKRCSNVWEWGGKDVNSYLHPTQKPVRIVEMALEKSSVTGDYAVDLFSGCGTSIVACENKDRLARAMDIDPVWVSVSLERFERLGYKIKKI